MRTKLIHNLTGTGLGIVVVLCSLAVPTARAQYTCVAAAGGSTTTSSLTTADPTQNGRILRDGVPSSCKGKANTLQNATVIHAKAFNFTNPLAQTACVTVDFNHTGCGANTTENVAYSTYNPATPAANEIGDAGFSSTGIGSYSFSVAAGASYTIVVHEITPDSGCASFSFTISYSTNCRGVGTDRDNNGIADLMVFRPSNTTWYFANANSTTFDGFQFGQATDTLVPEVYQGGGFTNLATFTPTTGTWVTPNGTTHWGLASDVPVPGDYDRDGKADLAVFRAGAWYILRSSDGTQQSALWGQAGDVPIAADFDGDRIADYCVVRPNDPAAGVATWYVLESNFQQGFFLRSTFGQPGDIPVPADYDGDGKADIALFRPADGSWWAISSINQSQKVTRFGLTGDIPQPADYDGDKIIDIAVFRPSTGTWYWIRSSDGTYGAAHFGQSGDVPATTHYPIHAL